MSKINALKKNILDVYIIERENKSQEGGNKKKKNGKMKNRGEKKKEGKYISYNTSIIYYTIYIVQYKIKSIFNTLLVLSYYHLLKYIIVIKIKSKILIWYDK